MKKIDLSKKKKIAFVCSGGVVKAAAFHMGVAAAIERSGFRFVGGGYNNQIEKSDSKNIDTYVGSSAGSIVATFLAQGGSIELLESMFLNPEKNSDSPALKYWEMLFPKFNNTVEFFSTFVKLLKVKNLQSPFDTEGIVRYLREHVIKEDDFSRLSCDLFVLASELNQSTKVVFSKYNSISKHGDICYASGVPVSEACAASMSLPPLYHPRSIEVEGRMKDYYDGEIIEPLSSHVAKDVGADLIICSYTHQPYVSTSIRESLAKKGLHLITLQSLYQAIEQKIRAGRLRHKQNKQVIDELKSFLFENNLKSDKADKMLEKISSILSYNEEVDYIYIHPRPSDKEMFLSPHFSLNSKSIESIYKKGFVASFSTLRNNCEQVA